MTLTNALNHYMYIYHTSPDPVENRIVRFEEADGMGLNPTIVYTFPHQARSWDMHLGGNLRFGPDGKLYVTVGEDSIPNRAQDPGSSHGKIHRFNARLISRKSAEYGIILGMDFPIVDRLDDDLSAAWLLKYFHRNDLRCPHCGRSVEEARVFRVTRRSRLTVYRCPCQGIYNLYSGTVFEGKHLRPAQAILLLRGVCKGEPTTTIAREIGLARQTVHNLHRAIQANAARVQPQEPLSDQQTETDERFQNAGGKRETSPRP